MAITKKSIEGQKEKILLLRLDRLGDLILTLPAIHAMKESFPDAKIEIIVHKEFVSFVQEIFPDADVIGIERNTFFKKMGNVISIIRRIKKTKYEYAVDLFTGTNHLSSILLFFANAKRKCGYGVGMRKYFLKEMVPPAKQIKYETGMVMDILKVLSIPPAPKKKIIIQIRPVIEKSVKQQINCKDKDSYVVIHPWASEETKEWPVHNYIALIKTMLKEKSRKDKIILIGSREEKTKAEKIINVLTNVLTDVEKQRIKDMTGEFQLIEIAALIKNAVLFIGGNSGPMHIAATFKTPSVIISGYSSPIRWDPPVKEVNIIRNKGVQNDYEQDGKEKSSQKMMHITAVSVEKVYEAVQSALKIKEKKHG